MVPSVTERITELSRRADYLESLLTRRYLTAKEVRARYGWSRSTFWRKRHALPPPRPFPGDLWLLSDLVKVEEADLSGERTGRTGCPG